MATHRKPVQVVNLDAGVFPDLVSNQLTTAAAPSIGTQTAFVMADGGSDEGAHVRFSVPKNYVGTPKLVIRGALDGAPGASDTLGFGVRKKAVAPNEAADGTYDAEVAASVTVGSSGLAYSDEDLFEVTIDLTAGDFAVDDEVFAYVYLDASGTTYAGNVLVTSIEFQYADA